MIRLLKIIGICFLIGLSIPRVNACSCDTIPFSRAIEDADEIFIGRIIKAEKYRLKRLVEQQPIFLISSDDEDDDDDTEFLEEYGEEEVLTDADIEERNWDWKFTFKIKQKWKGGTNSELVIYLQGHSCDFYFDIHKEYLVYASNRADYPNLEKVLSTWLCSRTTDNHYWKEENWFEKDVERLDKEFPIEIKLNKYQFNWTWITIISFLILGIVFGVKKLLNHEKKV